MSEQDSPSVSEVVTEAPPQLGQVLAAQRELKKMTVGEVASQLRLGVWQINAMESNDFTQLPEPMITRGFIRNYARLLGVDAEPLVQAHRALSGMDQPHSLNISSENISIANHHTTPWLKIVIFSFLVLLIIFGLSYYAKHPFSHFAQPAESEAKSSNLTQSSSTEPPSVVAPSTSSPSEEKLPEPALPIAERIAESELSATTIELPASKRDGQVASAEAVKTDAVKEAQAPDVDPASPQMEFELIFTEQSWVSVVDGDNKEIYRKLSAAGASEKVVGKSPLKLHIGNAAGTKVSYKGQVVDLGQYTRNNIARLTLSLEKN